jgi:hypothetical protein
VRDDVCLGTKSLVELIEFDDDHHLGILKSDPELLPKMVKKVLELERNKSNEPSPSIGGSLITFSINFNSQASKTEKPNLSALRNSINTSILKKGMEK